MEILAIIPARKGSKGIKNKNLRKVGGVPLVERAVHAALASDVTRIVVSTDCPKTRELLRDYRSSYAIDIVERPETLAGDYASVEDVERHVIDEVGAPDMIVRLFSTCPFRDPHDINACVSIAKDAGAGAVVSVTDPTHYPSQDVDISGRAITHADEDWRHPRQHWRRRRIVNGAVYVAFVDYWNEHGYFGPQTIAYEMPRERSLDIDTPFDLKMARALCDM